MRVVCYGDSNTYGYDPRDWFGGRYPADSRWVDLLAGATGWQVINAGMNGRGIPCGGAALPDGIDLMIIMLGSNDLLQGSTPAQAAADMETFLRELPMERARILLVAPPPMRLGAWVPHPSLVRASAELAEQYRALARRLGTAFADAGEWGVELSGDGVHFTPAGHRAFAAGLLKALTQ